METIYLFLIGLGFFLSILFTLFTIKRLNFLQIIAEDLHKKAKPKKPKIGGIGIAAAFCIIFILAYFLKGSMIYLLILLTFLVSASIGLMDDALKFPKWRKLIFPAFGAIPLLLLIPLDPFMIIFLFFAVAVVSNWTNMLAGFNGLESGLGAIVLFFLALNTNVASTAFILYAYCAILLGFLIFNKYPAKIFPGDAGTLPIGTILIASTLLGAPILKLGILLIPYFLDSLFKFTSVGIISSTDVKPTEVKGKTLVVDKSYLSLSRFILKLKPLKEWQLVLVIWALGIGLGVVTLLI